MINLVVDEAYAFDYLSILEVKFEKLGLGTYNECLDNLYNELGYDKVQSVLISKQYEMLKKANEQGFWLIEELRTTQYTIDARVVDKVNMERFKAKKLLQESFFKSTLSEVKT